MCSDRIYHGKLQNEDYYNVNILIDACNKLNDDAIKEIHTNMSHDIVDAIIFHLNRSYYGDKFIIKQQPTEIIPSDSVSVANLIFSKINQKVMKNIIISFSFVSLLWDDISKTIYITNLMLLYGYNENTLDMVELLNNCVRRYSKTVFEYSRTRREPVYLKTVLPFSNSDAHNYDCAIAYLSGPECTTYLCDISLAPFYNKMKITRNITVDWYNEHGLRFGRRNNDMLFNLGINASNTCEWTRHVDGLVHRWLI